MRLRTLHERIHPHVMMRVRLAHDSALPHPAWPVLQSLRDLAATPEGTEEARLLAVSARRARNRMADALNRACAALEA